MKIELIRSLDSWFKEPIRSRLISGYTVAVTIGNFDGLHLGHRELLHRLDQAVSRMGEVRKILFTFYPHPTVVLKNIGHDRLVSLHDKMAALEEAEFSCIFNLHFTKQFSQLSPEEFVKRYLVSALEAKVVVVGHDWTFGQKRSGNADLLRKLGEQFGFQVIVVAPILIEGTRVSTTRLRQALYEGDLDQVEQLLGRSYCFSARVERGEQRGSGLGFPTANLIPRRQVLPKQGVYATWAECDGHVFPSVTNIGTRPTFSGTKQVVEVHVIGETGLAWYRKRIRVWFIKRLRDEIKFRSVEELKAAIGQDVNDARLLLSARPRPC